MGTGSEGMKETTVKGRDVKRNRLAAWEAFVWSYPDIVTGDPEYFLSGPSRDVGLTRSPGTQGVHVLTPYWGT